MIELVRIIEVHILPNHPHDSYVVFVLALASNGHFKAAFDQVNELNDKIFMNIAHHGKMVSVGRSKEIFSVARNPDVQFLNVSIL